MFRPALGLSQYPIQLVPGGTFPVVKWLGCEADHSLPYSDSIRKGRVYISGPTICPYGTHGDCRYWNHVCQTFDNMRYALFWVIMQCV